MVDFISILRFLRDIFSARNERKERIFEKLIVPAQQELLQVHQDYVDAFSALRTMLPKPDDDPAEFQTRTLRAEDYLLERSLKFEPLRRELLANSAIPENAFEGLDPEVRTFYRAVVRYLMYGDPLSEKENPRLELMLSSPKLSREPLIGTRFTSMLDTLKVCPEDAIRFCEELIADAKTEWINVCEIYARLRFKSLSHT